MKFLFLIFLFCCCSNPEEPYVATVYNLKYEVNGTGLAVDASLTYENSNGDTSQISEAVLPWTLSINDTGSSFFAYISAQNNYSNGTITTRIYVNDDLKKESTSSGGYVIATSSGSVGDL